MTKTATALPPTTTTATSATVTATATTTYMNDVNSVKKEIVFAIECGIDVKRDLGGHHARHRHKHLQSQTH